MTILDQSPSMTASAVPARRPSWLGADELRPATEESIGRESARDDDGLAGSPEGSPEAISKESLRRRTREWLRREIDFIPNPEFMVSAAGQEIFREPLGLAARQPATGIATLRRAGVDLPVHLGRLCEAPLLKPFQERLLFRRMNFLLQQAAMHRSVLNPDRPSRHRLDLIDRLVALAEWHRDRIVEANLRLVFSVVKKFVNVNNHFDDLLSDGIIALIRAVEKFDYDRGFRFSTYATQVLRRNAYRTVVLNQQERQKTVGGLQDMEIDVEDEDRGSTMSEKRWHELRSRLGIMLNDLDRREKFIIRARFSLGSHRKVHTLQALADRLGVSKERVRQLERRAMEKMRAMAGNVQLAELEA